MGENLPKYEEFNKDQEAYNALVDSLIKLAPQAILEKEGDTLKLLDDAAFCKTLLNMALHINSILSKDSKYINVRSSGGGSSYRVEADLVEPVAGIKKVEYHFNKDIS